MRIEGTSNIHDWQVESTLIGGAVDIGANFPTEPGQNLSPGKLDAAADSSITVRSLKSVEKDGKPYSDKMDEIMYEKLKAQECPKITFHLTELTLKQAPASKEGPYACVAKGDLVVAGVTNAITMPVNILPLGDKKLKISGSVSVKMTSFKIEPPSPKWVGALIKTGDDVKLIFEWMVAPRPAASK
jgi:hypothetical protein